MASFSISHVNSATGTLTNRSIEIAEQEVTLELAGRTIEVTLGTIEQAIQNHLASPDPHPQYLTEAEGDALYQPIGVGGEGGVTDHGTLTGLGDDDHPQYLLANGTRNLSGNLTVAGMLTVDSPLGIAAHQITLAQEGDEPQEVPTKEYVDTGLATKADTTYVNGVLPQPSDAQPTSASITSGTAGTSTEYARADHKHVMYTGTPLGLGSAAAQGSSTNVSRADHVHPYPTAAEIGAATPAYVDSRIWKGTQAAYDAIGTYDPDVLYVVTG